MLGVSIIVAALILATPLFALSRTGRRLVAGITELNASIDQLDASVAALVTAVGSVATPPDLQPAIDRINADRATIDAQTTALGGTPPPP